MTVNLEHIEINGRKHPLLSLDNKDCQTPPIHFTGANGFPVAVYHSFLSQFSQHYSVHAADCRGTFVEPTAPPKPFGFEGFANDLIEIIEATYTEPVIAMGHSFGGYVSLLASIKRPELFKQLILIDPASLPNPWVGWLFPKLPSSIINRVFPLINKTLGRQQIWPDRNSFRFKYQTHSTFKNFTDEAMQAYVDHGLRQRSDGQYELVFDPVWEAYIYASVEFIWNKLIKSHTPCLFLRAEHSYLYTQKTFDYQNKKLGPHFTGLEIPNTHHLMPFESPSICANTILNWLSSYILER